VIIVTMQASPVLNDCPDRRTAQVLVHQRR
jgi:hypothetical protein